MPTLYGIRNCDTVRRARRWLDDHGVAYTWHDLRDDGLDKSRVARWLTAVGVDTLVNRRGRTWREIPETLRDNLDSTAAAELLVTYPTLVKRPVLEDRDSVIVGFDPELYRTRFLGG